MVVGYARGPRGLGVPVLGLGLTDHKMGNGIEWDIMGYITHMAHMCRFIYYILSIYIYMYDIWVSLKMVDFTMLIDSLLFSHRDNDDEQMDRMGYPQLEYPIG